MADGQTHDTEDGGRKYRRPDGYLPPEPVGKPFEGDPAAPFPFETEAAPMVSQPPPFPYGEPPVKVPAGQQSVGPPPGFGARPHEQPLMMPPEFTEQRLRGRNANIARRNAKTALAVGIASLLAFGIVLGPVGVVLGIRAIREGEKNLGWWAVAAGVTGFVSSLVLLLLVATGVIDNPLESMTANKGEK